MCLDNVRAGIAFGTRLSKELGTWTNGRRPKCRRPFRLQTSSAIALHAACDKHLALILERERCRC